MENADICPRIEVTVPAELRDVFSECPSETASASGLAGFVTDCAGKIDGPAAGQVALVEKLAHQASAVARHVIRDEVDAARARREVDPYDTKPVRATWTVAPRTLGVNMAIAESVWPAVRAPVSSLTSS